MQRDSRVQSLSVKGNSGLQLSKSREHGVCKCSDRSVTQNDCVPLLFLSYGRVDQLCVQSLLKTVMWHSSEESSASASPFLRQCEIPQILMIALDFTVSSISLKHDYF